MPHGKLELYSAGFALCWRAALGSAALSGQPVEARSITGRVPWQPGETAAPEAALSTDPKPLAFFTNEERTFVDAAVSRRIPKDDLGPGAKEVGVTVFLDRQLAECVGQLCAKSQSRPSRSGA